MIVDLAGTWSYLADKAAALSIESATRELFANSAKSSPVPSQWSRAIPELLHHHGVVWYGRAFESSLPKDNSRMLIEFDGVDYAASVWVNGREIGGHTGYFEPFRLDATDAIVDGTNRIVVRVDAPRDDGFPEKKSIIKGIFVHHDCRPGSGHARFAQSEPTGGIWGGVRLRKCGPVTLENVMIRSELNDEAAIVFIQCELMNRSKSSRTVDVGLEISGLTFDSELISGSGSAVLEPESITEIVVPVVVQDPRLWWTWTEGRPDLYDARIEITESSIQQASDGQAWDSDHELRPRVHDSVTQRFGIRTIQFDLETLTMRLNGRRVFHRGSNYIPTQWLSTYSAEKYRADIELMKEANLNSIRVHAHVLPRSFYELADEAGIMVWADFALIWSYDTGEEFAQTALDQFRALIRGWFNHPSIWLWCAHNEGSANDALNLRMEALGRKLDPTRVNLKNSGKWPPGPGGWNDHEYAGWYNGSYLDFHDKNHVFITEYGAQAMPENAAGFFRGGAQWPPDLDDWEYHDFQVTQNENQLGPLLLYKDLADFIQASQKYQYDAVRFATEAYRRRKFAPTTGLYHFMFTECWPAITWAVVDHERKRKLGFHALRDSMAPVLVSIATDRRTLAPGEMIRAGIWIVSDLREPLLGWTLRYDCGHGVQEMIVDLPPDCSREITSLMIGCEVAGFIGLRAELLDDAGRVVSTTEWEYIVRSDESLELPTLLDLSKELWEYLAEDRRGAQKIEVDDRGWSPANVPFRREEDPAGSIGWYRVKFDLPGDGDPAKPCALEIGAIDEADETYVNERFVGKTGEFPPAVAGGATAGTRRLYILLAGTLKTTGNVLAIRVHQPKGRGGIWKDPIRIMPIDDTFRYRPVRKSYP